MSHTRNGDTKHHNKKTQPTTPRPGQLAIKVHGLWWEVRSLTFSIWLVHEKCFIMYSRVKYYLQIHFKECEIYIEVLYDYIYHWMAYRRSPPLCGSIYLSIWILAICTLTVSHTNFSALQASTLYHVARGLLTKLRCLSNQGSNSVPPRTAHDLQNHFLAP